MNKKPANAGKKIILGICLLLMSTMIASAAPPKEPNPYPWCVDQSSIARDNTRLPTTIITFPYGIISQDASVFYSTVYHYGNVILNNGDVEDALYCWSEGTCLSKEDVQWIHEQRGK